MSDSRERLLDVVLMLVEDMHPSRIEKMASLIRGMNAEKRVGSYDWGGIVPREQEQAQALLDNWRATDVTPEELAGMFIGAGHAYHAGRSEVSVQLVWTGPSTELVAMRKTEQVLLEIVGATRERIFLTSFVAYQIESVVDAMSRAIDRGVDVSILLESSEQHGGDLSLDSIDVMRSALPGAKLYYWKNKSEEFVGGRVHAKVVVADASVCFVSSANLTGHAMDKNMEAGVLVRGADVPDRLHRHLEALVTKGLVSLVR